MYIKAQSYVIIFNNLTCNIDIKIKFSCVHTLLWLQCESNYFLVSEQEASWISFLKDRYGLGYKLIVSVGQIPENTEWAGIEIGYSICQILEFWIELYLSDRYLRIQTETVSGLILTTVFVWTLSSGSSCICRTDTWEYRLSHIRIDIGYSICVNLEFWIELYLSPD